MKDFILSHWVKLALIYILLIVILVGGSLLYGLASGPGLSAFSLSDLFSDDNLARSGRIALGGGIVVVAWLVWKTLSRKR